MPSSFKPYSEAFVWIWLPGEIEPVVAGKVTQENRSLVFNYGKSYLERENKISIYEPELPLRPGILPLLGNLTMPSCIRDGSPDSWGRRVLINRKFGPLGAFNQQTNQQSHLNELTFLLESGSDRIGALDFQLSSKDYEPRLAKNSPIQELIESAERVEKGIPLTNELDQAIFHGSSIGGARPKALIEDRNNKKYIAKFSSTGDLYSVIKFEYIAMRVAKKTGLDVASVILKKAVNKDVLLVERFDRVHSSKGWQRKNMVSALTIFGLDEMEARYSSYESFAEIIRHRFYDSSKTLKELFKRMVFNILSGNTDDHARNHAAFWDGKMLSLTPAYDICPQPRTGGEASQAMLIYDTNRLSRMRECIRAAPHFQLSKTEAIRFIEEMIKIIIKNWIDVCEEAQITEIDKKLLMTHQFFNSFAFENLEQGSQHLQKLAQEFKSLA